MKCPNCGSEHIQYATKTSGGGFSFGNSCCGYILLGPLGLLCGACGSGTHTKEFWICQDCGTKFSNWTAQQKQSQENAARIKRENDNALFLRYTEELAALHDTEGDFDTIRRRAKEASERKEIAQKRENEFLSELKACPDKELRTLANRNGLNLISYLGLAALGISVVCFFVWSPYIGIALFACGLALIYAWSSQESDARKNFPNAITILDK